jgi:cytochrome P450
MQIKDPLGQLLRARQHVLADNAPNYLSMAGDGPDPLLGRGLFASKGDFWLRQRRMVQPAFHRPRLARMVEGMVRDAQLTAESWAPQFGKGEPVELLTEMRRLSIRILGTSIFSSDLYEKHAPLREALDFFTEEIHGPRDSVLKVLSMILRLRRPRMERFMSSIEHMNTVLYGQISERRQSPAGKDDMLSMLLEARDTQGVAMTDTEVRDELVSLYVGGYESTAVALTWVGYEVARQPEVQQRVHDELATVLGGRPATFESLQSLPYTRAVVDETLRLHPPAWQFVRRAAQEDRLGDWTVPADTKVLISPYLLHRHPAFWEQPERFMAERFLPEQKERRHRYAYLPFGAGQRQCVGNAYTVMLITLSFITLLQRYQLRLARNYRLVPTAGSTHRPRNGVLATLQPVPPAP